MKVSLWFFRRVALRRGGGLVAIVIAAARACWRGERGGGVDGARQRPKQREAGR